MSGYSRVEKLEITYKMEDLKSLKKVKGFDISEYQNKSSKIENVEMLDAESKDFGDGVKQVRQLKITSANLSENGEPVKAIEFVALKLDVESNEWGIPENPDSKAMKVLNYFEVEDFSELIGKECLVVKRVKGDKSFLGIHYG